MEVARTSPGPAADPEVSVELTGKLSEFAFLWGVVGALHGPAGRGTYSLYGGLREALGFSHTDYNNKNGEAYRGREAAGLILKNCSN